MHSRMNTLNVSTVAKKTGKMAGSPSDPCPFCETHEPETVEHFLLRCPRWEKERFRMTFYLDLTRDEAWWFGLTRSDIAVITLGGSAKGKSLAKVFRPRGSGDQRNLEAVTMAIADSLLSMWQTRVQALEPQLTGHRSPRSSREGAKGSPRSASSKRKRNDDTDASNKKTRLRRTPSKRVRTSPCQQA